ncbi:CBL-interacting serine/threonine-protein kinase 17 isoform X2 [Hevea brasiliensis]|uniref:CBL-interacting serine/threonine-protein kinase 17 isoform X2 n=1 Tax=Hevea brasiliensis TaxID=3981 RepID=UPI0025E99655|nr:CBL-interacting serine/threonine-protein kinase 17 isoform X2 [Hevea brasiliensis]
MRLGKYELGRTLGEGNFGKVKLAKNIESGQPFAVKILEKNRIIHLNITDQIKREIATLKLLKHPNVVRLYEVLASKSKIYMVLEYVNGGELFDRIASKGKLSEAQGRKLFQQLIDGVSYCHSKGVFHRDLKLENVLVDAKGNIKISDFGLSALPQHFRIFKGDAQIPKWLSPGAQNMIRRILDPNPVTRITVAGIKADEWFKQDYTPADPAEEEDDIYIDNEAFSMHEMPLEGERSPGSPALINAFQLIGMSSCLDLSGFFEKEDVSERKIRFTSSHSLKDLLEKIEDIVTGMGFRIQKKNGKLKVVQENKEQRSMGSLAVAAEVFEISPSLHVVELHKSYGDPSVYRQLCKKLSNDLSVPSGQGLLTTQV